MKKVVIFIFVIALFSFTFALDVVGGLSYNTYNFDFYANDEPQNIFLDEINKSMEKG
ncbi:MAG TPA: hypothetical protein GXX68_01375 [Defluviitoga tunisiensis]|jgi:hypothetical protein|nr:hypothetical protein [Defluviitoga tunisiensis]